MCTTYNAMKAELVFTELLGYAKCNFGGLVVVFTNTKTYIHIFVWVCNSKIKYF